MKTLSYQFQPLDNGAVVITAKLTRRNGPEVYLCDTLGELKAAMDEGVPFVGHTVVGMRPKDLIVNPAHVVTIEAI